MEYSAATDPRKGRKAAGGGLDRKYDSETTAERNETGEISTERGNRDEDNGRETTAIGAETGENEVREAGGAQKSETSTGKLRGPQKRRDTE